jgi:hypothetical protein
MSIDPGHDMAAQMIETSIVRARGTRDRGLGARGAVRIVPWPELV